jgi:hypothetical protein
MGGAYNKHGRDEDAYKILIRKPQGTRQLKISSHRWEDNIRIDLRELGWEDVD